MNTTLKNKINSKMFDNMSISKILAYIFIFFVVISIIISIIKNIFEVKERKILLNDPYIKKSYAQHTHANQILSLEKRRDIILEKKPANYESRVNLMNIQIEQLKVNEGYKLKKIPDVPTDLSFTYSISFKLRNNSNSYKNYCFFYRGRELENSSPSFWINPVDSTMIIKVTDYNNKIMELKTEVIPLQRWNTAKIVFNNRNINVHLNNELFATFVLEAMPRYSNGSVKIHPNDSYKFINISKVIYYGKAINIPI